MPAAEISRSECAERARLLRVQTNDVALDLTRGDQVFGSVSVIRFGCTEVGAASYADLIAETVHEITLNGTALDPAEVCADGRIVLTGLAAENELCVVADFAYRSDGTGLHRSVDSADGRVYLYAQLYPAEAREVFACFTQQDLKAEFTFHVTAPAHWIVLSNQPDPAPEPVGNGTAVWHFPVTQLMCPYHGALAAGEYHLVWAEHVTPAGRVIPVAVGCRASLAEHLEPGEVLDVTERGLDYYPAMLGADFAFGKYDQIFVPEFSAGANANPGLITISERLLFQSRATEASYERRARIILHELGHQWFGALVTPKWWDDVWLSESFAELCGHRALDGATRYSDAWTGFCAGLKVWGYRQDQLPSTHPVSARVNTLSEALANFDGISYAKGASVLKQLAAYLGDEQFLAGLRAYFERYRFGNVGLADLVATLGASAGTDLTAWSRAWLETAGVNTLRADFTIGGNGCFTEFAVLQGGTRAVAGLRPQHIAVGLYDRAGDDGPLVRTRRVALDVAGPCTPVPELAGQRQPDLILLNNDDLGYATVRFDERSLQTVLSSIGTLADPLARALCWGTLMDMALQGELSAAAFVRVLAAGLGQESSDTVLQSLLDATRLLLTTMADPDSLPHCQEVLTAAALGLLRAAEPGGDRQRVWAELLTRTATTPDQLGFLATLLDGSSPVSGLDVDAELRWALLLRLATFGRAAEADIDAELARDATDDAQRHATACRAAMPDAAHKAEAWRLLAESDELGADGILEVSRAFSQPEHARLLAPYAKRYFALLPEIWFSHGGMRRVLLGQVLFPYAAASPELLAHADEFLAVPRDRGLSRVVIEGRDRVVKALRARAGSRTGD